MLDNRESQIAQEYVCSITPTEFEKYCRDILLAYAEEEKLADFQITHDTKMKSHDGTYQIDLYASFTALHSHFDVICECKQYKNSIGREKVVILADKVKSLGAHKGILLATSGFQSGAVQYAKEHGIALIQVYDRGCEFLSHSSGNDLPDETDPFLYAEKMLPPYRAIECTANNEDTKVVYPPKSMVRAIYLKMNQMIKEQLGIEIEPPDI